MKMLVTGLRGTVAPALADTLRAAGHTVVGWDRGAVPPEDAAAVRDHIHAVRPDGFFHLATGAPAWAEEAARTCAAAGIPFLFTSSVSVYSSGQRGPFGVEVPPQPHDDYGRYKLDCEQRVHAANHDARVVRIGWQIGDRPGGNHMLDHLERTAQAQGFLEASVHWYQACSFLADTAAGLAHVLQALPGGLYHLDGNPGLTFHEIVCALNRRHGNRWDVRPVEAPRLDNRLLDPRVPVRTITDHFG